MVITIYHSKENLSSVLKTEWILSEFQLKLTHFHGRGGPAKWSRVQFLRLAVSGSGTYQLRELHEVAYALWALDVDNISAYLVDWFWYQVNLYIQSISISRGFALMMHHYSASQLLFTAPAFLCHCLFWIPWTLICF